jgi:hypothetical protein
MILVISISPTYTSIQKVKTRSLTYHSVTRQYLGSHHHRFYPVLWFSYTLIHVLGYVLHHVLHRSTCPPLSSLLCNRPSPPMMPTQPCPPLCHPLSNHHLLTTLPYHLHTTCTHPQYAPLCSYLRPRTYQDLVAEANPIPPNKAPTPVIHPPQ